MAIVNSPIFEWFRITAGEVLRGFRERNGNRHFDIEAIFDRLILLLQIKSEDACEICRPVDSIG